MKYVTYIGDSMTVGFGGVTRTFPWALSARMGWLRPANWDSGNGPDPYIVGSAGFINSEDRGDGPHVFSYFLSTLVDQHPDVVVVEGGTNDPDEGFGAAVNAFFGPLRAQLPSAEIYVVGTHGVNDLRKAALSAATLAVGGQYVDWTPFLTGTGNIGTPHGDGDRDIYILGDGLVNPDGRVGLHPTTAGHAYLGTMLAFAISPPSTGLDY